MGQEFVTPGLVLVEQDCGLLALIRWGVPPVDETTKTSALGLL